MHSLILSFKREDVLRALAPRLAIVRIDMGHDMSDPILEVLDGVAVSIEVPGSVPFPVEVDICCEGVVTVDRHKQLDAVAMGVGHEVIQPIQNSVVPTSRATAFKAIEAIDRSALDSPRLSLTCQL